MGILIDIVLGLFQETLVGSGDNQKGFRLECWQRIVPCIGRRLLDTERVSMERFCGSYFGALERSVANIPTKVAILCTKAVLVYLSKGLQDGDK